MSIEKLLGDLIDALTANTTALNAALSAKTEVLTAAAKLADKAKPATKKDADDEEKPARTSRAAKADDDEKPARRSSKADEDDEKPASKKDAEPEELTIADIKKMFTEYLGVDDKDEADKRTANVKKLVTHLGIEKITQAKPRDFDRLAGWLKDLKRGRKPDLSEDDDSGSLV